MTWFFHFCIRATIFWSEMSSVYFGFPTSMNAFVSRSSRAFFISCVSSFERNIVFLIDGIFASNWKILGDSLKESTLAPNLFFRLLLSRLSPVYIVCQTIPISAFKICLDIGSDVGTAYTIVFALKVTHFSPLTG